MTRTRTIVVIAAGIVVLVLAALIVWQLTSSTPGDADPTPAPSVSAPPTPSVFPTPTPGSTDAAPTDSTPIDVGISDTATVVDGVTVDVVSLSSFEADSKEPGDLAGPALKVLVRVTNGTDAALDLGGSAVNLASGEAMRPAPPLGDVVSTGLPASLAAGQSAEGEYSFSLPADARDSVTVTVDLLSGEPMVAFTGAAPAA